MSADDLQQERRACLARARSIPGHAHTVCHRIISNHSQSETQKNQANAQTYFKQTGLIHSWDVKVTGSALSAVTHLHVDTNADRNTHAAQAGISNQLILMPH